MRTLLYVFVTVIIFVISGCALFDNSPSDSTQQPGGEMHNEVNEFQGPHYAKLNSIGCLHYNDMEMTKSADFDTIDNLIREKRCFVIPTDTDVFIKERVKGDIVSAKLKGSTQLFYTVTSNLAAQ